MAVDNLTKENFWNDMHSECPEAVEHFRNWIDNYKKEVNWETLFGGEIVRAAKFHDLPFEMQNGIIARYELELFNNKNGEGVSKYIDIANHYKEQLKNLFRDVQRSIILRAKKLN